MRIFDAHFHVIDPRFPLVPNQGYLPDPFTVDDYRRRFAADGGAVVSGSFQAYDQTYLVDALERLGPTFVGVTQIPPAIADEEVLRLAAAGVRAFRVNLNRGGDATGLEALAERVHALAGWHLEIQAPKLPELVVPKLVIDHLGLGDLPKLLEYVERGAYVKASGFGRVHIDIAHALRAIAALNPQALVFATDLPGTRAPRPFADRDLELVRECAGEAALWLNAQSLYRL